MSVEIVAEICGNHNGDLGRAHALVDAAAESGATTVKAQYIRADALYAPGFVDRLDPDDEIPDWWIASLSDHARARGLAFGCSVYARQHVEVVAPHVDLLKIASYSILDVGLLTAASTADVKTVAIGLGLATMTDVAIARRIVRASRRPSQRLVLLHCQSDYPADVARCALGNISWLAGSFGEEVGWSDHSVEEGVVLAAVLARGATMIELHVDLGDGAGRESRHSWSPSRLAYLTRTLRTARTALNAAWHPNVAEERWRADPEDGLRPLRAYREELSR